VASRVGDGKEIFMSTINVKEAIYTISEAEDVDEGQQSILIGLQTLLYPQGYSQTTESFNYAKSYLNPSYWQYIGMTQGTLYFPKGEYYLCGSHVYNKYETESEFDIGQFVPQEYPYKVLYKNQFAPDGSRNLTPGPQGDPDGGYSVSHPISYLKIPKGISLKFDPGAVIYFGYVNAEQRERDVAARRYPTFGQFIVLDIQGEIEARSHKIFDVWQTSPSTTFHGLNGTVEGGVDVFNWAAMSGMVLGPRMNRCLEPAWWGVSGYQEYAEVLSIPKTFFDLQNLRRQDRMDDLTRRNVPDELEKFSKIYFHEMKKNIHVMGENPISLNGNEVTSNFSSNLNGINDYLYDQRPYRYYTKTSLLLQSCVDASWPGQKIPMHGLQYVSSLQLQPDRKYDGYGAYIKRPPTIDLSNYTMSSSDSIQKKENAVKLLLIAYRNHANPNSTDIWRIVLNDIKKIYHAGGYYYNDTISDTLSANDGINVLSDHLTSTTPFEESLLEENLERYLNNLYEVFRGHLRANMFECIINKYDGNDKVELFNEIHSRIIMELQEIEIEDILESNLSEFLDDIVNIINQAESSLNTNIWPTSSIDRSVLVDRFLKNNFLIHTNDAINLARDLEQQWSDSMPFEDKFNLLKNAYEQHLNYHKITLFQYEYPQNILNFMNRTTPNRSVSVNDESIKLTKIILFIENNIENNNGDRLSNMRYGNHDMNEENTDMIFTLSGYVSYYKYGNFNDNVLEDLNGFAWRPSYADTTFKLASVPKSAQDIIKSKSISSIRGFKMDGSVFSSKYDAWNYEQQHLISCAVENPRGLLLQETREEIVLSRMKTEIKDCMLFNTAGEGIALLGNIEASLRNSMVSNCWRGGLTGLSGNTRIKVENIMMVDDVMQQMQQSSGQREIRSGIDIEPNTGSFHEVKCLYKMERGEIKRSNSNPIEKTDLMISGLYLSGDLDVGCNDGSLCLLSSIICDKGPINFVLEKYCNVLIANSIIHSTQPGDRVYPSGHSNIFSMYGCVSILDLDDQGLIVGNEEAESTRANFKVNWIDNGYNTAYVNFFHSSFWNKNTTSNTNTIPFDISSNSTGFYLNRFSLLSSTITGYTGVVFVTSQQTASSQGLQLSELEYLNLINCTLSSLGDSSVRKNIILMLISSISTSNDVNIQNTLTRTKSGYLLSVSSAEAKMKFIGNYISLKNWGGPDSSDVGVEVPEVLRNYAPLVTAGTPVNFHIAILGSEFSEYLVISETRVNIRFPFVFRGGVTSFLTTDVFTDILFFIPQINREYFINNINIVSGNQYVFRGPTNIQARGVLPGMKVISVSDHNDWYSLMISTEVNVESMYDPETMQTIQSITQIFLVYDYQFVD
jgi:hypothetical protein